MRNARALLLGLAVLLVLLVTFLIHHLTREPHVTRPPVPSDLVDAATGAWAWTRDVDFVYTWVNGSDEAYRDVRRAIGGPEAVGSSRDRESNELVHSLRSVELWAPWWKGRLFIVAPPGQYPAWINLSDPRIHIIDQETLFPRRADLPTFNSNAIEQHLWRIPGLSDIFVHMNDDYFFGSAVYPRDLFTENRGVRFFFEPNRIHGSIKEHDKLVRERKRLWLASVYNTIGLLDASYNTSYTRHFLKHAPFVYHKSVFASLAEWYRQPLEHTSASRFRDWNDVITPLLHHYTVIAEQRPEWPFEVAPLDEMQRYTEFIVLTDTTTPQDFHIRAIAERGPRFFTLNDGFTQTRVARLMTKLLDEMFPEPSSFERRSPGPSA